MFWVMRFSCPNFSASQRNPMYLPFFHFSFFVPSRSPKEHQLFSLRLSCQLLFLSMEFISISPSIMLTPRLLEIYHSHPRTSCSSFFFYSHVISFRNLESAPLVSAFLLHQRLKCRKRELKQIEWQLCIDIQFVRFFVNLFRFFLRFLGSSIINRRPDVWEKTLIGRNGWTDKDIIEAEKEEGSEEANQ
jgi:hypothetical protein